MVSENNYLVWKNMKVILRIIQEQAKESLKMTRELRKETSRMENYMGIVYSNIKMEANSKEIF